MGTLLTGLGIDEGAGEWPDLQVLHLDMCQERLLFPEHLIARRIVSAVELGLVDVLVPLQPTVRSEALPASVPVACKGSRGGHVAMGILHVPCEMVFARKRLVAAGLSAGKGSLLAVGSHVGFEAAWSVEALAAAVEFADVVPLATSLTLCPQLAIVGKCDFVVFRGI